MTKTIIALRKIVSSHPSADADALISEQYPKLSTKAASGLRKDVQDFIDGKMPESMLKHYISENGIHA